MILALAGLHGSGKSHLASHIAAAFGWRICIKRDLLKLLHTREGTGDDWVAWYRELYTYEGVYRVTQKIISLIPQDDRVILDSVHNLVEWRVLKDAIPNTVLASVIAPRAIRMRRNGPEDTYLDIQRIRFWHNDEQHRSCLAAECDWCFNGAGSAEVQRTEFKAFLAHYALDE